MPALLPPESDAGTAAQHLASILNDAVAAMRADMRRDVEALLDEKLTRLGADRSLPPAPTAAPTDAATDPAPDLSTEMQTLHVEIAALMQRIEQTKYEVANLVNTRVSSRRIDVVKDELGSVVADTEGATATILEAMERIDAAARHIKANSQKVVNQEWADEVLDQVVKVFEACNFQDLTGQRINKVVNTLKFIEERVASIIAVIGEDVFADFDGSADKTDHPDGLEKTLSQPTKDAERVSQEDIDKLFG